MTTSISGFPELLPAQQIIFNQVIRQLQQQFELYGFVPMETPAVERVSTLLSKGNDHEIYGIYRLAEAGGAREKDLALRFDLTVPLARYVVQHYGQLIFPYRRYHIAPVWRGERPQAGRYRQFYQCDIDIIGDGDLPLIHDAEILSLIWRALHGVGVDRLAMTVNNRLLLKGLILSFGIDLINAGEVIRVIDKAEKISLEALRHELQKYHVNESSIEVLLSLITRRMCTAEWLDYLPTICAQSDFQQGFAELKEVIQMAVSFGMPPDVLHINPTLARGLDYYTGTICEVKMLDYPDLGSVCGGGRYANLSASLGKKALPGVGMSIGLSRLILKLLETGRFASPCQTTASVLITTQHYPGLPMYIKMASVLRDHGVKTEVYLGQKPLGSQMKYAARKGFKFAIIADEAELNDGFVIVRTLADGQQAKMAFPEAMIFLQKNSSTS